MGDKELISALRKEFDFTKDEELLECELISAGDWAYKQGGLDTKDRLLSFLAE